MNVRDIWLLWRHQALSYRILDKKLAKTSFLFRKGAGGVYMVILILLRETLQTRTLEANSSVFSCLMWCDRLSQRPILNHVLAFCFVIGWQRRATQHWFPVCHHPPSGAPPSCPAATRRASPNSTAETVRMREFRFWWANRVENPSYTCSPSISTTFACPSKPVKGEEARRPLLRGQLTSEEFMFAHLCGRNVRTCLLDPPWLIKESLELFLLLNCRKIISRDFQKVAENWQICCLVSFLHSSCKQRQGSERDLFVNLTWKASVGGGGVLRWRLTEWRSRFARERVARLYPTIKEGKQLGEASRASSGSEWFSAPGRLQSAVHAPALFNGWGLRANTSRWL